MRPLCTGLARVKSCAPSRSPSRAVPKLVWAEVPDPEPAAGEVLIDVAATAVNRADLLQRRASTHRRRAPRPPGPGVLRTDRRGRCGCRPAGRRRRGVRAAGRRRVRRAGRGARGPGAAGARGRELVAAGGLPEVACTVWSNSSCSPGCDRARRCWCTAAPAASAPWRSSSRKALGARVVVTAARAAKLARCRELGADVAIDYRAEDFVPGRRSQRRPRRRRDPRRHGRDVPGTQRRGAGRRRPAGDHRHAGRHTGELDIDTLMRQAGRGHRDLAARPAGWPEKAADRRRGRATRVAAGRATARVRPVIDQVVPLAEAAEAHRLVDDGGHVGKVVLGVSTVTRHARSVESTDGTCRD